MKCLNCGAEFPGGKFCPVCGAEAQVVCPHCGNVVSAVNRFCPRCGGEFAQDGGAHFETGNQRRQNAAPRMDVQTLTISILNITAGALILLLGLVAVASSYLSSSYFSYYSAVYTCGMIALVPGAALATSGILQLLKKDEWLITLLEIVFGGVTLFVSCFGIGFISSGSYIRLLGSFLIGGLLLAIGILKLMQISETVIYIVEIATAGCLLIVGFTGIFRVWGQTAILASIPFLTAGIWSLVAPRR